MEEPAGAVDAVGVVADEPAAAERVADAVRERGGTATVTTARGVADADLDVAVTVGEASLLALARIVPEVPVVPVDAGRTVASVPGSAVEAAVERVLADPEARTVTEHPVLAVFVDGEHVERAFADVSLVTAEVAHISEYSVSRDDDVVASVRADAIVVATPAGSGGYARAAGGPLVAPGTDVGVVAPVAPFQTDPDHWVLPLSAIGLGVERDTAAVDLYADDRRVREVGPDDPVRLRVDGHVETVRLPESTPAFDDAGEKL